MSIRSDEFTKFGSTEIVDPGYIRDEAYITLKVLEQAGAKPILDPSYLTRLEQGLELEYDGEDCFEIFDPIKDAIVWLLQRNKGRLRFHVLKAKFEKQFCGFQLPYEDDFQSAIELLFFEDRKLEGNDGYFHTWHGWMEHLLAEGQTSYPEIIETAREMGATKYDALKHLAETLKESHWCAEHIAQALRKAGAGRTRIAQLSCVA
jgi:hypothetical protein